MKKNCLNCPNRTKDWYCVNAHHKGGFLKKIENKEIVPEGCPERKKISVICLSGLDNFIDPIIEGLASDYFVRKFVIKTPQEIFDAINWGDIIWLEWANEAAIIATNYEGIKNKKVILRLHSYEIFTDFPKQINWFAVDRLIFVAPHIRDILKETIPDIDKKVESEVIYNGIDIGNILFKKRKGGYNITWVGYINHKKNPPMTLQIMKKLVDIDKRYTLHIAGSFQDTRYKIYLEYMIKEMGLQDNIKFYGWVENMEQFWEDKNYLLHTSIHEGHSLAITEAMARGIKPVIHNFRGAKELYANLDSSLRVLFNTVEQATNRVKINEYYSKMYRDWVIDKGWTLNNQIRQIKKILEAI